MKKRLTKIFGDQLISSQAIALPQSTALHVVLKSGDTLLGKLIEQTAEVLQIQDNRFHLHRLELAQIDVVVFDYPSSW
jgi:hypothetical protein